MSKGIAPRRGAPGAPTWTDPILTASEIVALVRRLAPDAPADLTLRVVDDALCTCSLGRGGGRGKRTMTIARWIEAFDGRRKTTAGIGSKSAKKQKRKTRR